MPLLLHFHVSTNTTNSKRLLIFPPERESPGILPSNKRKWRLLVIPEGFVPPTNFHAGSLKDALFCPIPVTDNESRFELSRAEGLDTLSGSVEGSVSVLQLCKPVHHYKYRWMDRLCARNTSREWGWRHDRTIETFRRYFGNYRRILIFGKKDFRLNQI